MQESLSKTVHWSNVRRFAFRFAFVYLILYNLPFPLGAIPHTDSLIEFYNSFWHKIAPWVGKHALHLKTDITVFTNGSTDTTYDYVLILCFLAIALAAAIFWSFLDHPRANYDRLNQWLLLYVRLSVGSAMLSYGAAKIFQQQFLDPNWYQLLGPFGKNSPNGLLWMFMGSSHGYRYFTGCVELAGGILLFVPRLRTLGALIGVVAFTNVFALNISYNAPVKISSLHLLLMSIFLLLPDARRLVAVVLLNRSTIPQDSPALFRQHRRNTVALALQVLLGLFLASSYLYQARDYEKQNVAYKPPFYGIWIVEEFTFDGKVLPPLLTDDVRWQRMIFQFPKGVGIQGMSGSWTGYWLRRDMEKKTFALEKPGDAKRKFQFSFLSSDPRMLVLDGTDGEHSIGVKLHRVDEKEFALLSDHFQWIHEDSDY
jgi:uncharacterized membrane protein YphA (DoxX/SURF4 family)